MKIYGGLFMGELNFWILMGEDYMGEFSPLFGAAGENFGDFPKDFQIFSYFPFSPIYLYGGVYMGELGFSVTVQSKYMGEF